MRTISLRQFRDSIPELNEPVIVQRRDKNGDFQKLGHWIPAIVTGDAPDGVIMKSSEFDRSFNTRPFRPVPKGK